MIAFRYVLKIHLLIPTLLLSSNAFIFPHRSNIPGSQKQQLYMENGYLDRITKGAAAAAATLERDEAKIQMIPLSSPPLLLLQSSAPVLSKEDCETLIEYFDHITYGDGGDASCDLDTTLNEYASSLLGKLQNIIDTVTNCPGHDGETDLPRYVRYHPRVIIDDGILSDPKRLNELLLPDGCHVDTNNGYLFRHVTAILYLTDNPSDDYSFGGGTTFPLAIPWQAPGDAKTINEMNNDVDALYDSANRLIERNIHHTKADTNQSVDSDGRRLEHAGIDTFHRDHERDITQQLRKYRSNNMGIRVMPQAGRLIMFHNVDDDGMPDATSFHGGEELIDTILTNHHLQPRTKNILVFFKEIPVLSFSDRNGFADCAAKARRWTIQTYYQQ